MKYFSSNAGDLLKSCAAVVIAYAILFQIIERTRMIEKIMALTFNWWELVIITAFIASRLATYLLVPATLLALITWRLSKRLSERPIKKPAV